MLDRLFDLLRLRREILLISSPTPNPSFLCSPKPIATASTRFAHPLNLMECIGTPFKDKAETNQSRCS